MADAWGSFSYDASEDIARAAVTPRAGDMTERLFYRFDDVSNESAELVLAWENTEVPIPIAVDMPEVVLANMEREMRSLPRFSWQGWNQIAQWALQNDLRLEDAHGWAQQSVSMNRNFANLMTLATAEERLGNTTAAEALRDEAMPLANEAQMNAYGYQLLGAGKTDDAIAIFQKNVEDHPESWNVYDSLGEGLAARGDTTEALAMYEKARSMAPPAQYPRIDGVLAQLRGSN
jgi:tetratricopeptide (TPR) repeat protein